MSNPPIEEAAGSVEQLAAKESARREQQMRPRVHYVGFSTTEDGREYTLRVTGVGEPRRFVMMIPHQAFASKQARFQDAPDLCCAKLTRLLAGEDADHPAPGRRMVLTVGELYEYRAARIAPTGRKRGARRGDQDTGRAR